MEKRPEANKIFEFDRLLINRTERNRLVKYFTEVKIVLCKV